MSRQKVVFLDAATYGDISLSRFNSRWDCTIHQVTNASETSRRLDGQLVAVTNKVVIDRDVLSSAKQLQLVAVAATGTDIIDRRSQYYNDPHAANACHNHLCGLYTMAG